MRVLEGGRSRRTIQAALVVASFVFGVGGAAHGDASRSSSSGSALVAVVGPRQAAFTRTFNPFRGEADARWPTWAGIHEPLIVCNRLTGQYTPWLATAHTWSPDNLKLRFTLRSGVRWSDGAPSPAATSCSPSI